MATEKTELRVSENDDWIGSVWRRDKMNMFFQRKCILFMLIYFYFIQM